MPKLNWGCGPDLRDGWINSDVLDWGTGQQHVGDIAAGLPFGDGHFDYAVSHHALQMIGWSDLVPTLVELRRVIKPGGWLRLSVPDLLRAFDAWRKHDPSHFPIADEHESSIDGKLCMYVTQAGATRSVFTKAWLFELLQRASFERIDSCLIFSTRSGIADLTSLDTRSAESLFVDARR